MKYSQFRLLLLMIIIYGLGILVTPSLYPQTPIIHAQTDTTDTFNPPSDSAEYKNIEINRSNIERTLESLAQLNGRTWHENLLPCPCQLPPENDIWEISNTAIAYYHPGATNGVRGAIREQDLAGITISGTPLLEDQDTGQQCTYDTVGDLISGGSAAGTPDLASPFDDKIDLAVTEISEVDFQHFAVDVFPWEVLGWEVAGLFFPPNTGVDCDNFALTLITLKARDNKQQLVDLIAGTQIIRLPDAYVGQEDYNVQIEAVGGIAAEFNFEATMVSSPSRELSSSIDGEILFGLFNNATPRGLLPMGLDIDDDTGIISGNPTVNNLYGSIDAQRFRFTVFAINTISDESGSQMFEILVKPPPVDIAFVIDTTGSMGDDIDAVQARVEDIINSVASSGADFRFSFVGYQDDPGTQNSAYLSKVFNDFSNNKDEIIASVNSINIIHGTGGDYPEAAFSGLMAAIQLDWREDARKFIICMGDAPAKNPDPAGFTYEQVINATRGIEVTAKNTDSLLGRVVKRLLPPPVHGTVGYFTHKHQHDCYW